MEGVTGGLGGEVYWDQAYGQGDSTRSWYQEQPVMSLRMLKLAGATPSASVIDVGGGAAPLADALLERQFTDLTVLDISQAGLHYAQRRLGKGSEGVSWVRADVLSWLPARRYQLWHDRAVFHFLTDPAARQRYLAVLAEALEPGGRVILGTFAADGPQQCSGLPVARYSPADLAEQLGPRLTVLATDREEHHTPAGAIQPFTWLLAQHETGQPTPADLPR